MYRLTLTRAGLPDEHRTATRRGEIRNAVWDLVRAVGWNIRDEDHAHLIAAAGTVADLADVHGSSAAFADLLDVYARPYGDGEDVPDVVPLLVVHATD